MGDLIRLPGAWAGPGHGETSVEGVMAEFEAAQRRRGLAESTIVRRRSHLDQWARWLGHPSKVFAASWKDLEAFDRHLQSERVLSAQTRYDRLSHLHVFYGWAMRQGLTRDDPTLLVDRPKLPRRNARPIRTSDLKLAMEHAPPMSRAWMALGAYAGLRCMEIAGLRGENIYDRTLFIIGKGDRERTVPVHPLVAKELEGLPAPRSGPVFRQPNGRPYTAEQVSRLLGELFADLGIAATAHQLRHWCGVHTYEATRDVFLVQRLLGHSDPKTTTMYSDVDASALALAVARLPEVA